MAVLLLSILRWAWRKATLRPDGLAFGSGDRESATETVDAFAVGGGAHSGVAGGEGDEFEVDDRFFYFPRVEPHGRAGFEGEAIGWVEALSGAED
jgi:hypothetical protein